MRRTAAAKPIIWQSKYIDKLSSSLLLPLHKHTKMILLNTENSLYRGSTHQLAYLNILAFNIERLLSFIRDHPLDNNPTRINDTHSAVVS